MTDETSPTQPARPTASTPAGQPSSDPDGLPTWVRPAIEFGPLITFFIVQRTTERLDGLYWATIALIATTSVAVLVSRWLEKRWPKVPLVTGIVVAVLGGLTIYLESELFIKVKPTVVYATFAAILLGGLAMGHVLLQGVLGAALSMRPEGWRQLTVRTALFCLGLALTNEVLRRVLSTDHWTIVKTFGYAAATMVFFVAQGKLFEQHAIGPDGQGENEPPGGPHSGAPHS